MERSTAEAELKKAETELDAACAAHGSAASAAAQATVDMQKAMMRYCDAAETLRRMPE